MYVCMFFYFSAATAQSKRKNTIKAEKKEAVENDVRCRTGKQYIV